LDDNWKQRLERARFEVGRAQRQYQAVEPENRLVVRELERQWEASLQTVQGLEQEYARFRQRHPSPLSDEQRELICSLAANLPALWRAPTTTPCNPIPDESMGRDGTSRAGRSRDRHIGGAVCSAWRARRYR